MTSTIAKINALLFAVIVLCALGSWFGGRDYSEPNVVFLPEMYYSIPYDSFAPNPNFTDGQTLQTPVHGTIARGFMPLRYEATPDDAARAGRELTNPFSPDDPGVLERGTAVYTSFCLHCHGSGGKGDGLVAKRGFPPPPSLLLENAVNMPEGQMFHVITWGQGNMPGHESQISREDRWKVITYINHSLQGK